MKIALPHVSKVPQSLVDEAMFLHYSSMSFLPVSKLVDSGLIGVANTFVATDSVIVEWIYLMNLSSISCISLY